MESLSWIATSTFFFFIFLFSYTCLRKKQFLSQSCCVVTVARIVVKGVLIFIATIATSISARVRFFTSTLVIEYSYLFSKKTILSNIEILALLSFDLLEISLIRITVSFSLDASEIIRKLLVKGNCKVNCLLVPRDSWSTVSRMFA